MASVVFGFRTIALGNSSARPTRAYDPSESDLGQGLANHLGVSSERLLAESLAHQIEIESSVCRVTGFLLLIVCVNDDLGNSSRSY